MTKKTKSTRWGRAAGGFLIWSVRSLFVSFPLGALACAAAADTAAAQTLEQLQGLSIEQLAQVEVTGVLRRPEKLSTTPAAVFVITAEDIRRSGAVTLPEVLRLAPNLEVAQVSAQTYVVSSRGFNATSASNKMLMLIDGRIAYEPVESQLFFDQLQVPLDDIERIEVISGPGGTLWGANAVNGVINIITKNSADTQGALADIKGGSGVQSGLFQYGGRTNANTTYRVYGQGFSLGTTYQTNGDPTKDAWHGGQGGFRTDWQNGTDHVLVEGDSYNNDGQTDARQYGGDLVTRWEHRLDNGSSLSFQTSYDLQVRLQPEFLDQYQSYDVQAQDSVPLGRHTLVFGGEYRLVPTDFYNRASGFTLEPARRTIGVGDIYAQDTFALREDLQLIFGTKLEDSTYTGVEPLPSVRLGWTVSNKTFLWAAVSRAARSPSRLDRDIVSTTSNLLAQAPMFQSEKLVALEVGYRGQPLARTTLSVSLYYNIYQDLRTVGLSPVPGTLFQVQNGAEGHTYGADMWGEWQVTRWWRLSPGLSLLHKALHVKPGFTDISAGESEGFDPGYQASLRSSMDLPRHLEFDTELRQVGGLTGVGVGPYAEADARLGWHATQWMELSLAGTNLLAPRHTETVLPGSSIDEAPRSVYAGLRCTF